MLIDYQRFRWCYGELMEGRQPDEVLPRWAVEARDTFALLAPLRHREAQLIERGNEAFEEHCEALYTLFALGSVSNYLLELGRAGDERAVRTHREFFEAAGLQAYDDSTSFSPFHHEIVSVEPDETLDHVVVTDLVWPGFHFGDLLFCRAGVRLRAPRRLVDPVIASTSTLYFTTCREPRKTSDLSHGWGHNSRWATPPSRWYEDSEGFHLNWDGSIYIDGARPDPPNSAGTDLSLDRRQELLLHRCFVRAPLPADEDDQYPYEYRLSLRTSSWPLPADAVLLDPRES
ncbi:hypothetical protein GCM10027569_01640 [Flindersiella endophytica]